MMTRRELLQAALDGYELRYSDHTKWRLHNDEWERWGSNGWRKSREGLCFAAPNDWHILPKKKYRWVNIHSMGSNNFAHTSRTAADLARCANCLAVIRFDLVDGALINPVLEDF